MHGSSCANEATLQQASGLFGVEFEGDFSSGADNPVRKIYKLSTPGFFVMPPLVLR